MDSNADKCTENTGFMRLLIDKIKPVFYSISEEIWGQQFEVKNNDCRRIILTPGVIKFTVLTNLFVSSFRGLGSIIFLLSVPPDQLQLQFYYPHKLFLSFRKYPGE